MNNDTSTQTVGQRIAAQFFNPQVAHGSHPRLAAAIDDAVKPLVSALEQARQQITLARCTLERKIQASDYVRSCHESDPAQYALAAKICEDINEFIHLAHEWTEKAEKSVEQALQSYTHGGVEMHCTKP